MNADELVAYLRAHPEWLGNHPELLTELTVPHPQGGQAISLVERQVLALRDKIRALEDKLAEFIEFADENDTISAQVHRLGLLMIEAPDFLTLSESLYDQLLLEFSVPHVAMRLWNTVLRHDSVEFEPVTDALRIMAGDLALPRCGPPADLEVLGWFGDRGSTIQSMALVPLRRETQVIGLLVLASDDPGRFYEGIGTLYLSRIGEMLSVALRRQLG